MSTDRPDREPATPADPPHAVVATAVAALPLLDHHVHGALRFRPDRARLEQLLTESDRPVPDGTSGFDTQLGLAVRRWCAPLLGLPPRADADAYAARREELGEAEVTRRMLNASGVGRYLVETGFGAGEVLTPAEMSTASGAPAHEVVRLETVFEELLASAGSAADAVRRYPEVLAARTANAVGLKSVVAYRCGFDFDPAPPARTDVVRAAGRTLAAGDGTSVRVADPVLLRFLLWCGVERGLPLQLHAGYGDPDLDLHRCDPLLLTDFVRRVEPHGVDLLLLHCYPFHRNAGYLAQAFPHVYFDVGLGTHHTGLRSDAVVAESLELAPFAKILFSSDGWGPAELHFLGAHLWRRGMTRALGRWVADEELDPHDATRIAELIGWRNAARVYRIDHPAPDHPDHPDHPDQAG